MYETAYGFTRSAFQLLPDARFFFESQGHGRAMSHLSFGLDQGEGFIVITGEVGTGKTTLVEHLWSRIDHASFAMARINTTQLGGDDLFRLALAGFGVEVSGGEKSALILRFADVLAVHRAAGRRCVLVVDEAQNLSRPALEELRMLSNLTDAGQAAVQTVLLGQPEFRRMLASHELDQLRQRVIASFHLGPLGPAETRAYIEHRLATVGWSGRPAIEPIAFDAVHEATGGVPRRINRLFSRVLLLGAIEGADTISEAMVGSTAAELARDLDGPPMAPGPRRADEEGDIATRVGALEQAMARREQVFNRLLDLLGQRA